jgi:hypothetical protein
LGTLGAWPRTLPARASEPWTLPTLINKWINHLAWRARLKRRSLQDSSSAASEQQESALTHVCCLRLLPQTRKEGQISASKGPYCAHPSPATCVITELLRCVHPEKAEIGL